MPEEENLIIQGGLLCEVKGDRFRVSYIYKPHI